MNDPIPFLSGRISGLALSLDLFYKNYYTVMVIT